MDKPTISIISIAFIIIAVLVGVASMNSTKSLPREQCVEHSIALGMHIHPELEIYNEDQKVTIPSNVGISSSCMKALHTHDDTGKIHIEYPEKYDFTLGDFFANWGQTLSKDQVMDMKADDTHTITMTVDGNQSDAFDKLTLKDHQKIVIRYGKK